MGEQVIVLTDLTKQYGNFTAVDHIRLNNPERRNLRITGTEWCWKINYYLNDVGIDRAYFGNS